MPAPIYYAHNILKTLAEARHSGAQPGLGPDAKSQVTLRYVNGKPVRRDLRRRLDPARRRAVHRPRCARSCGPTCSRCCPRAGCAPRSDFYVNPTGRFVIGGPDGDTGLTGRKIIVDTYGGAAPHGGGAFSGKDPTKVDRSAAYAARYLAKNVVAAGLADTLHDPALLRDRRLQAAVGLCRLHGTGKVDEAKLESVLREVMDLTPRGIREHLELEQADLCAHRGLRPFRPRARARRRLLLGEDSISSTS